MDSAEVAQEGIRKVARWEIRVPLWVVDSEHGVVIAGMERPCRLVHHRDIAEARPAAARSIRSHRLAAVAVLRLAWNMTRATATEAVIAPVVLGGDPVERLADAHLNMAWEKPTPA